MQSDNGIWSVNRLEHEKYFPLKIILLPDSLLKIQNLVIQFVFIICQVEGYQNILKLSCRPLAFTSYKAFLKK